MRSRKSGRRPVPILCINKRLMKEFIFEARGQSISLRIIIKHRLIPWIFSSSSLLFHAEVVTLLKCSIVRGIPSTKFSLVHLDDFHLSFEFFSFCSLSLLLFSKLFPHVDSLIHRDPIVKYWLVLRDFRVQILQPVVELRMLWVELGVCNCVPYMTGKFVEFTIHLPVGFTLFIIFITWRNILRRFVIVA